MSDFSHNQKNHSKWFFFKLLWTDIFVYNNNNNNNNNNDNNFIETRLQDTIGKIIKHRWLH